VANRIVISPERAVRDIAAESVLAAAAELAAEADARLR
jgi:hypothetical protein